MPFRREGSAWRGVAWRVAAWRGRAWRSVACFALPYLTETSGCFPAGRAKLGKVSATLGRAQKELPFLPALRSARKSRLVIAAVTLSLPFY